MSNRERKLEELGYALEDTPEPGAIYRSLSIDGRTAYCSGAVPMSAGIVTSQGKVPSIVTLLEAQQAAALCAANCLRLAAKELGSLDEIERVLRTTGYVNSDVDFTDQHLVVNGASQLLLDVFGQEGLAARTAIGVAQLPLNSSVEVEMIFRLRD